MGVGDYTLNIYIYIYVHPLLYGLYIFVNGETTRIITNCKFYDCSSDVESRFRKHSAGISSYSARRCREVNLEYLMKILWFPSVLC